MRMTITAAVILLILLVSCTAPTRPSQNKTITTNTTLSEQNTKVTAVIDGDTIVVEDGRHVRLICIDSPEEGDEGYETAKQRMIEFTLNKTVRLEKDVSETDEYGRLLRYVYVDGIDAGEQMVRERLATVFRYGPDVKKCGEYENLANV